MKLGGIPMRLDPTYVVAIIVAVSAMLGAVLTQGIRWLAGRPVTRAELLKAETDSRRARSEESDAVTRQLLALVDELRTARDRDRAEDDADRDVARAEASANRETIVELREGIRGLETQVRQLEQRIVTLIAEAKQQMVHIGELREILRGAGVEPPEQPSKID